MKNNILMIVVDQLAWKALSVYGNKDSKTPNIDSLSASGVTADSCYCSYPLCQPSRASLWSGQHPHRNRVWSNGRAWPIEKIDATYPALGATFRDAGYETRHYGKCHDGGALRGFVCSEEKETHIEDERKEFPFNMDTYADKYTLDCAVDYISSYDKSKPLFAVVDFINPHNICGWIGVNKGEHENTLDLSVLPELPDNFDFDDISSRPLPVQYLCCSHVRQSQTSLWTRDNFREYLAAYYYYLNVVDRYIGEVLKALKSNGMDENTLIVFTSDHGDNMTSRRSVTKQVTMYEEVTRVPLIFSGAGVKHLDKPVKGLCSLLDIFPTLCSYAGIDIPKGVDGIDIRQIMDKGTLPEREFITSEWFTEWGYTISPGRMIRKGDVKYIKYLEGNGEELYLLDKDPGEKHNVKDFEPEILSQMRALLDKHIQDTDDPFYSLEVKADKRWRSHKLGYDNHRGIAAPEYKED